MKFAYKYRRSIAFALYVALLTTTALPAAMARPFTGSSGKVAGVRSVHAAATTASIAAQGRTSAADSRKPIGRLIPAGVTTRSTKGVKGFAGSSRLQVGGTFGANIQEQVVDITNVTDNTLGNLGANDERHPFWTADEQTIYYSSNQSTSDNKYQLWRIPANTNGISTDTGINTGAEIITSETGAIHDFPTLNQAGNRIAYIKSTDNGATFQLYQTLIPSSGVKITPQLASDALTLNKVVGGDTIKTVGRPSWLSGTEIVVEATFTNNTKDLVIVDFQSRLLRKLTTGTASEENPTVSPDGTYVAFDSDATAYNGANSAGTGTARNVFVINANSSAVTQITNTDPATVASATVNSVQPAWSRSATVPIFNTSTTYYLAFASDRRANTATPATPAYIKNANGTRDIYYVPAISIDPNTQVRTITPEATGSAALKLDTRDTNLTYDDQYPTWPALLNIQRLGFQSNRKGSSATTFTSTPTTNDLFVATLIDITAPNLLRYDLSNDTGEVVHINAGSTFNRTGSVRSRSDGITPGTTLFFTVRAEDLESGVKSVYLQFKNPNSKYQSLAQGGLGVEHKEYTNSTADAATQFEAPFVRYEAFNGNGFPLLMQPFAGFGNFRATANNLGQEYEAEVVSAASSQQNGASSYFQHILNRRVTKAPFNNTQFQGMYEAGLSDLSAFSGSANPPPLDPAFNPTVAELGTDAAEKAKGVWLKLDRLPQAQQDGNGGSLYGASWKIPSNEASDWYMDVIIYDNAVNPFDVNGSKFNWIIYDNVWGFSSAQALNSDPADILFVADHTLGQKFAYTRFGDPTASAGLNTNTVYNLPNQVFGVESYYTDRDFSDALDGARAPDAPAATPPTDPRIWDTQGAFVGHPASAGTQSIGSGNLNIYNPLGFGSFVDPILAQDSITVSETTRGGNRAITAFRASTGRYSIWRILSRGAVPLNVLNDYLPSMATRPPNTAAGETAAVSVPVVSRVIVWASPFTLTTYHGPGIITDLQTQQALSDYVQAGGRLFVSGQDVAFALGNGSPLLAEVFGATIASSSTGGTRVLTLAPNTDDKPILSAAQQTFVRRFTQDAFLVRVDTGTSVIDTGAEHSYSELTATSSIYSPPNLGPLELMVFRLGGPPFGDYRGDASFSSPSVESAPNFNGFLDVIQPIAGKSLRILSYNGMVGDPDTHSAMVANQYGAGVAVFASFGFEGLGNGWYDYTPTGSTVVRIANHARRAEIMHNITCSLRTGIITGRIIDDNGSPVSDAIVSAGGFTGLTDANGNYTVFGLPPGSYTVTADRAGYYRQSVTGNTIHGAGRATVNLTLRRANPGRLTGVKYTLADSQGRKSGRPKIGNTQIAQGGVFRTDDKTGIGGVPILIYRTEATATGVRYTGFLTRTSTGDANNTLDFNSLGRLLQVGEYEFPNSIPVGNYKVICNPKAVTIDGQAGSTAVDVRDSSGTPITTVTPRAEFSTVTITSPTQTNIDLQADDPATTTINESTLITSTGLLTIESDKTAGIDFRLASGPQSITGEVREDKADGTIGAGISGITVSATLSGATTPAGSAVTDANGAFTLVNATDNSTLFPEGTYVIAATTANGYDLTAEPTGTSKRPSVTVLVGGNSSVPVRLIEPAAPTATPPTYGALLLQKLPPGSVSGLVIRSPGSIPTTGATVNLYNSDASGNKLDGDGDATNGITPAYTGTTMTVSTSGSYQFNYLISNVNTGTYVADVNLKGFSSNPIVSAVFTVTSNTETRNINFTLEAPKIYGGGVQLLSIPQDYSATSAANDPRLIFGLTATGDNNGDGTPNTAADQTLFSTFNVADWTGTDYNIQPTIPLNRGKGYFVRFAGATAVTDSDAVAATGDEFSITLQPGWNLIGHPFARLDNAFAVPSDIDLVTGTKYTGPDGVESTFDEAVAKGYIRGVAYGYTGENSNSQYFQSSTLKPYLGYWFRNTTSTPVTMKFLRPTESAATRAVKTGKVGAALTRAEEDKTRFRSIASKSTADWRLQLAVRQGDLLDTDNSVGVAPSAKDGFDTQYDTEKPPVMTAAPQVYLSITGKNETGRATALADDIRDGTQTGGTRTWDVTVKPAAGKGDVTVFWPNVNRLPRGIEPYLVDVASGKRVPLRYASSYTYTPSSEEMGGRAVHQLRIEVAKPSSLPLMLTGIRSTRMGTDSSGRGVNGYRIAFTVTREADVTAEIQTLSGKVVNRIQTRARSSSESVLFWNGRSTEGTQLPAGAYILNLSAKDNNGAVVTVRQPIVSLR